MTGQPQDQLIQKQHDAVVAQALRVPTDDRQPFVQGHIAFPSHFGDVAVGGQDVGDQIADELKPQ